MLRLIANEKTYGNRLASTLGLSTPAIHRHMKYLEGFENQYPLVKKLISSPLSFSGRMGAKAAYYGINERVNVFFSIYKNFIHSHIFEIDKSNNLVPGFVHDDRFTDFTYLQPAKDYDEHDKTRKVIAESYDKINEINAEVLELERQIASLLHQKDKLLEDTSILINTHEDINYEKRTILKSLLNLGVICTACMSNRSNIAPSVIESEINSLIKGKWLVNKDQS
jgi:predicted transcriptional regulator